MLTSCGLIITDGSLCLLCHVTLSSPSRWDLPKGVMEDGESAIDCVVREVYEETGVVVDIDNLLDLGIFDYMPNKNLHLFVSEQETLPPVNKMTCVSTFERYGKDYPEVDNYMYCSFKDLKTYASPTLFTVLDKALVNFIYT